MLNRGSYKSSDEVKINLYFFNRIIYDVFIFMRKSLDLGEIHYSKNKRCRSPISATQFPLIFLDRLNSLLDY